MIITTLLLPLGHIPFTGAVPLLEGDIEVYSPLPILPVSGENLKISIWAATAHVRHSLQEGIALRQWDW
jgi:hypothetical protein